MATHSSILLEFLQKSLEGYTVHGVVRVRHHLVTKHQGPVSKTWRRKG